MKGLITTLIFTLVCAASYAQNMKPADNVSVTSYKLERNGGTVDVEVDMAYQRMLIRHNERLTVTPMLVNGMDTLAMRPVVFTGSTRDAVRSRERNLNDMHQGEPQAYEKRVFHKREIRERAVSTGYEHPVMTRNDKFTYNATVPYSSRMDGAGLFLSQQLIDCSGEEYPELTYLGTLERPRVAAMLVYIVPEPDNGERTSEMTSHLNFEVDKAVLRRNIARNDRELDRIYEFTSEVLSADQAEVKSINIRGFASPEAPYDYNDRLAVRRVEAIRDNLQQKFGLPANAFNVSHVAEDWDSLRNWIESSDIRYREELLAIIDNTADPDARDGKIKALDGGNTYSMLLHNVYPQLRRVDYAIDYTVKPMTAERARVLIFSDPHSMSLSEMHTAVVSYPTDSDEYATTLRVLTNLYPDDVTACNNMAAAALRSGDTETARKHLERVMNDPRCRNNIGVLLIKEGKYDEAERWFREAASEGSREAEHNLANLMSLY